MIWERINNGPLIYTTNWKKEIYILPGFFLFQAYFLAGVQGATKVIYQCLSKSKEWKKKKYSLELFILD